MNTFSENGAEGTMNDGDRFKVPGVMRAWEAVSRLNIRLKRGANRGAPIVEVVIGAVS